MKTALLGICLALCCAVVLAQNTQAAPAQQPPSYPNYSIMLVNPAGGAVVLMHNPKNEIEYVDASKIQDAFRAGYVPVRVAEIADLISYLRTENARLTAENGRLQNAPPKTLDTFGLNETNCHTYEWLKSASVAQLKECASRYPASLGEPSAEAAQPPQSAPSQAEVDAQLRQQAAAEQAARRQQIIQAFMMMQNANRPQTMNLNVTVTNCSRFPALCAGR